MLTTASFVENYVENVDKSVYHPDITVCKKLFDTFQPPFCAKVVKKLWKPLFTALFGVFWVFNTLLKTVFKTLSFVKNAPKYCIFRSFAPLKICTNKSFNFKAVENYLKRYIISKDDYIILIINLRSYIYEWMYTQLQYMQFRLFFQNRTCKRCAQPDVQR